MPKTNASKSNVVKLDDKMKIQVMSELINRAKFASRLGRQYDGDRNVYQALGYPETLTYIDYEAKYERHDIAKAIINRPVQATWHGDLKITYTNNKSEKLTPFQKSWQELCERLKLKLQFIRLDKLATLGEYGVLFLGFDDVSSAEGFKNAVTGTSRKLLYVKPLSQDGAKISASDDRTSSPRYGLPILYDISTPDNKSFQAHYTRVIHVTGEVMEDEVNGVPYLQAPFNRLVDLEKLVGASAEMFWRGARPGYKGKVDDEHTITDAVKATLEDQIKEYENDLRRFLILEGIDLEALQMQVSSPLEHVLVQFQAISAVTGIPIRILLGSERGELASSEDRTAWLELIQNRRTDYAELQIIRPLIDRCVQYGIMPKPKGPYKIIWSDVFAPSEQDRAKIGQTRASALQSYMNNPAAEIVIPPEVFIRYMLGLDEDTATHVLELYEAAKSSNVQDEINQINDILANPPKGGGGRPPATGPTIQEEE